MYKNIKVEGENLELILKNSHGDHTIIPANKRDWVKNRILLGKHSDIDEYVNTLPHLKDYAEDGTVIPGDPPNKKKPVIMEDIGNDTLVAPELDEVVIKDAAKPTVGRFFKMWGNNIPKAESFMGAIGQSIGAALSLPQAAATYIGSDGRETQPSKALKGTKFDQVMDTASNLPGGAGIVGTVLGSELGQDVVLDPLNIPIAKGAKAMSGINEVLEHTDDVIKNIPKENLLEGVINKVNNKTSNFNSSLNDHINGIQAGVKELMSKESRSFSEIFPITKAQRDISKIKQDKAFQEGLDFVDKWVYDQNGNLKGDVAQKIEDLYNNNKFHNPTISDNTLKVKQIKNGPLEQLENNQVVKEANNILTSSRTNQLDKSLTEDTRDYILKNKDRIGGVNTNHNESITLRNKGLAQYSPELISDIATHELGHSMQKIGGLGMKRNIDTYNSHVNDWSGILTKNGDDVNPYFTANKDTETGRMFADAMVEPKKGVSTWEASPMELHSELMVARKNLVDKYLKRAKLVRKNATIEEVMGQFKYPTDELIDELINVQDLNRFFKKETSQETKRALIKLLPGVVGAAAVNQIKE